jgi:hypothetical protein
MKGLLLRVGIDKTYGRYNAPINPLTNDYLYMPIPEGQENPQQIFRQGMQTTYAQMDTHFSKFTGRNAIQLAFPERLRAIGCHLDPDFENLTYGDQGSGRGNRVRKLDAGDFIAFFASFRPIPNIPCDHVLVYALYGIFFIDDIKKAKDVSSDQWHVNAHTRIQKMNGEHLIAFADKFRSGRFRRAIPIGEYRNGAYRVSNKILDAWGDIGVKDGFIQRSVCPPWFTKPEQFLKWLDFQQVELISNNWG